MPIYYSKVDFEPSGSPSFIIFRFATQRVEETNELRALRKRIERAAEVVRVLYESDEDERNKKIAFLHGIASCLKGDILADQVVMTHAEQMGPVEEDLIRRAASKHSVNYGRLTKWARNTCIGTGLVGALIYVLHPWIAAKALVLKDSIQFDNVPDIIAGFAFVICGASAGLWLNGHIRHTRLNMDTVLDVDPNFLTLGFRFQATILLALVAAILFYSGLVKVEILGFKLNDFAAPGNGGIAFVLGVVIALDEAGLIKRIYALARSSKSSEGQQHASSP